jgi:hypothetical protein
MFSTMKNVYTSCVRLFSLLLAVIILQQQANAQAWTIAVCSGGPPSLTTSSTYGPMYSVATANATSREAVIYPAFQLTGIAASTLTNAYFHRATASGSMAGTPNFKIYLKEISASDWGSTALDWATAVTGATLVFDGNPASIVGSAAGWKNFPFTTNFAYSGSQNLAVFFEYTNATASTAIAWSYEYTSTCVNTSNNNTTKYSNVTTGTLPTSLSSTNYRRPYIAFDYSVAACTSPPTAGAATANPSTPICSGTSVSLNLAGNSSGTGQTYVWQKSTDATAPHTWTDVSTSASSSSFSVSPTTTTFYRATVTCSGSTTYSDSVKVTLNPAFPSGTYTINLSNPTGGTNYQTFGEAVNALSCGIAGPIVFNVEPGAYAEQVIIPAIGGASSTNTITFKGNLATIAPTSAQLVTGARYGIWLNGADHIIIDSLNVDVTAGTYGYGIMLTNQADSNTISNCNITTVLTNTTATNYIGIGINGNASGTASGGNNGNDNQIINNTITGGYYGVYLYGLSGSTTSNLRNIIRGNIIKDAYLYSIYSIYQNNLVISKNDISRPTRTTMASATTTTYGIYLSTATLGALVEKNRIHNMFDAMTSQGGAFYSMYVAADATAAQPNKIENNLIRTLGGNTNQYGIYNTGSDYMYAYHNTISLDDQVATTGISYGFYQTTAATGVDFRNNIVYISRSGTGLKRAVHFATTTSTITSDRNVLYISPSVTGTDNNIGTFGTTAYATLPDWQGANSSSYDQNSISVDPMFLNPFSLPADYTPQEASVNNLGTNLGVLTDITDVVRSVTSPDPGAFEFSIAGTDAAINWVSPTMPATAGLKTVIVSVANNSTTGNITSVNLSYTDGGAVQTQNFTGLSIAPGASQNLSFTTQYNLTSNVALTAYLNSVNGGTDLSQVNDTTSYTFCFALNGAYTINPGNPTGGANFNTFADAVSALTCGGVSGPVVFNVEPAVYPEQVVIPAIDGTSSTNTIKFRGNLATVAPISTQLVTGSRHGIWLNGADHIIIDSLNIDVSTGTYGWGIILTNQADSNIISNSAITTSINSTATNYAGVIINGSATGTASSGNNGNDNQIINNTITGGYYAVYLYGNSASTTQNLRNIVRGNAIREAYLYSIYTVYQTELVISKNDISRPTRTTMASATTTTYGIAISTGTLGALIEKNRIHNMFDAMSSQGGTFYSIYVAADGTVTQPNRFENNLVYNIGGNTNQYGIYNTGAAYMSAYHNTISLDDQVATTGTAYGFYQTTSVAGIDFRNNIVYISRSGTGLKRALYFATTTSTIISDRNVLYINPSVTGTDNNLANFGTTVYATLVDWKGANSNAYDQNSISVDPTFANPSALPADYTPTTSLVNNIGISVGVSTDILNITRNITTPDPGAYEFSTLTAGVNMGAEALVTPMVQASGCYGNAETVTIKIRNNSFSTIDFAVNPVTVTVNVTGAVTQTLTKVLNTGTLASDATMDVIITTPLDMTAPGTYTFNASTSVTGDVNTSNDAMLPANRTKVALSAGVSAASPDAYCAPSPTNPTLASPGVGGYTSLQWLQSTTAVGGYSAISGGTTIPYTVSTALTQTMYYRLLASCGINNDTSAATTVTYNNPQVLTSTGASRCGSGNVSLNASGSAGSTLDWYAASTGGSSLGTGSTFTTPSISNNTTYYVAASIGGGGIQTVGPNDLSIGAFATWTSTAQWLNFSVLNTTTIQSVDMFWSGTVGSNFTIVIRDAATTTNVFTYTGTTTVTGSATAQVVPINATLPPGNYQMNLSGTNPGTYRNSTGGVYPYTIPGVISITGNTFDPVYYYMFYRWQVVTGCASSRTAVTATINPVNGSVAGTSGSTECGTVNITSSADSAYNNSCGIIAKLIPSGASPVSGSVNSCVTIDNAVQFANGQAYVQRHYDITPASNASTATGTVTLFFLQSEFDAYNTAKGSSYDSLPSGPNEGWRVANLRITQFHGTGSNPSNFTGSAVVINPDDNNIVWNATANRWEITFDVTGFSGFYVHTGNFVLPVTLVNFKGERIGAINKLSWQTETEANNSGFELQRSADGINFSKLSFVATKADNGYSNTTLSYSYNDENPLRGNNYYRLKQVDKDGKYSYSTVVLLRSKATEITLSSVYPNPAQNELNLVITSPSSEKVTIVVTDLSGKVIMQQAAQLVIGDNQQQLKVQSLASGTYIIKAVCSSGCETAVHRFVKQ